MATRFAGWGLPTWLVPVIGLAEVGGGLLLLVPRTALIGGLILAVVMLGATFTHLLNGEAIRVPLTLGLTGMALAVSIFRHRRRRTEAQFPPSK